MNIEVRKIAVLRANAVGDFIVALPALEALRSRYPHAEIVLLGRHWHSTFLADRPGPVDRTIVVPYSEGIYDPPDSKKIDQDQLKRFFDDMIGEHFDLALQLHGGGKNSNGFVRNLHAGLTLGARTPDAPPLDRCVPYRRYQNETLRLLEIVGTCHGGFIVRSAALIACAPAVAIRIHSYPIYRRKKWRSRQSSCSSRRQSNHDN